MKIMNSTLCLQLLVAAIAASSLVGCVEERAQVVMGDHPYGYSPGYAYGAGYDYGYNLNYNPYEYPPYYGYPIYQGGRFRSVP